MTSPASGTDAQPSPLSATNDSLLGRYLWYDHMTTDESAARAFYTTVVGWTTTPFEMGPGAPAYTMWTNAAGAPIGGVMRMPEQESAAGVPAHWLSYVGTPDVDATVAEAERLGASTHVPPTDIPTVGRFAVLTDPQGAYFALFTPSNAPGPMPAEPGLGDVSWHELYTTDLDAAFDFYRQLLGWSEASTMDMGPEHGRYLMYGRGGQHMYGGMMKRPTEEIPPMWTLYFRVPDVDAAVATVKEQGGQVLTGPMEVPGGDRVAICRDPQGGAFGVHQRVSQPSAS
ncbi:Glyoxalase-like domain protein (plasmid) [Gemmatirosa kalamazoonensis]|uniref:Glyoxalase-like domain protein n=1 Tax=Gemmatirosa kalamazoonensis TaxID=861299 RepID=W0RVG0_9BACT|nr:VOC family protein [Gemmatirosa kalamazoonensis]AHG93568.1 Glyoxalase-like domain protein [Gemmatirosa kalamazoonensis]